MSRSIARDTLDDYTSDQNHRHHMEQLRHELLPPQEQEQCYECGVFFTGRGAFCSVACEKAHDLFNLMCKWQDEESAFRREMSADHDD